MTQTEYDQLLQFSSLPIRDDESPLCDSIVYPPAKENTGYSVWEATTLNQAREYLEKEGLVPKGAIRYYDGSGNLDIFTYFWEERKP
jgi:hypothetical protein